MKIHEHQGKELLRGFDVPVAAGGAFFSATEAADFAGRLFADGARAVAVKAQIHAGGRGKGGGVKIVRDAQAAAAAAESILGMNLVTPQTGAGGQIVKRLLVEAGVEIEREFYLGLVVDRARQQIVVMGSSEGGMEIEEVAARAPEKIQKMWIDPVAGIDDEAATAFARAMEIPAAALPAARQMIGNLARAFAACDASMIEINPLALTADGGLLALDAKINFDDNAKFRHPEWETLRDRDEEDPAETAAAEFGLSYISLDGEIGCMVNGAGLAMATMDIIKLQGGAPANFLDVGGGANVDQVRAAFRLMLGNPKIRAILINIFGGIMRCDIIAQGVVDAAREIELKVPLVVRLEGTNVDEGRRILAESGLPIVGATTMADAAAKAVAAAKKGGGNVDSR